MEFEKEIENLHKGKAISDFEHKQLICLNYIVGNLVNIDTQLRDINNNLQNIKNKLDVIANK